MRRLSRVLSKNGRKQPIEDIFNWKYTLDFLQYGTSRVLSFPLFFLLFHPLTSEALMTTLLNVKSHHREAPRGIRVPSPKEKVNLEERAS